MTTTSWQVPFINQDKRKCWRAAAMMMRGGENFHLDSCAIDKSGRLKDDPASIAKFVEAAELVEVTAHETLTLNQMAGLIERGPILLLSEIYEGAQHAYVVVGMNGEYLEIHDPWAATTTPTIVDFETFVTSRTKPFLIVLQTTRPFVHRR